MRHKALEVLRCPTDAEMLALGAEQEVRDGHVMEGVLTCNACGKAYAIQSGIPNFIGDNPEKDDALGKLKSATISRFGYEWRHYADWGWLEAYPDVPDAERKFFGALISNSQAAFASKSMLTDENLVPGKWVLDAGCGNGRFSYQAASRGAQVVGVDLGDGVMSAFAHTRHLENVHIVRGDLFNLPLLPQGFDTAFSIGVLMHTGNAARAFQQVASRVKPGGCFVAHVYARGRRSYEIIDRTLRAVTVKLPISSQMLFAKATAAVARWFLASQEREQYFWRNIYPRINLLPTDHHMFDWWSAPVATHHTLDKVMTWFAEAGFVVKQSNPRAEDAEAIAACHRGHGTITVLGRRPLDKG